ncbi:MAG: bifunctional phosphoribosyl-AMP cyclohydrolase/phosphoribosyl-ATP diphosphatase HisIE [Sphingomonadales bacterium]|jgi:phosphoribosyl-ATP pyrophosphohydrolase/phosphoribosyl-AMP cyclohydrolase|tara:strand:+ start:305 stop:916 length:612 start_codon:yes stop_codon:yes gene_type:complete
MINFDAATLNWEKANGLIPAIIQDNETKTVLMLGFMNAEALSKTIETGLVTFYSRTRDTLWVKGETSGNHLKLFSLKADCDRDTILVEANPVGPTCHKGWETCFNDTNTSGVGFLNTLNQTITQRAKDKPEESYTAKLISKGTKRIAQKVGEEAVEVVLAATTGDKEELINESADLLYHLMVLWQAEGVEMNKVTDCLKKRSI